MNSAPDVAIGGFFVGADAHIGPPPAYHRTPNKRKQYDEPFPRGEGAPKGRMRNAGRNLICGTGTCLPRTPDLSS